MDVGENRPLGYYTTTDRQNDTAVVTGVSNHASGDTWNLWLGGFPNDYIGQNVNVTVSPHLKDVSSKNFQILAYSGAYDLESKFQASANGFGLIWINPIHYDQRISYKENGFYKITITLQNGSKLIRYLDLRVPYPY